MTYSTAFRVLASRDKTASIYPDLALTLRIEVRPARSVQIAGCRGVVKGSQPQVSPRRNKMSVTKARVPDGNVPPPSGFSGNGLHDTHSVQFYGEDSILLDGLSRYIGESLEANGSALVVATPAHRDGLTRRLEDRGVDIEAAIGRGATSFWTRLRHSRNSCSRAGPTRNASRK